MTISSSYLLLKWRTVFKKTWHFIIIIVSSSWLISSNVVVVIVIFISSTRLSYWFILLTINVIFIFRLIVIIWLGFISINLSV